MTVKRVGIIGFGNIGREVAKQLTRSAKGEVVWVIDRSPQKVVEGDLTKAQILAGLNPDATIYENYQDAPLSNLDAVVEVTGAADAVQYLQWTRSHISPIKFVTANKKTIALHPDVFFAEDDLGIEAAVAAGLPLIRSIAQHQSFDTVTRMVGILNGTSNYVLGKIRDGGSLVEATKKAAELGYAEPVTSLENIGEGDLDGMDSCFKLAILSRLAFGIPVDPQAVIDAGVVRGTRALDKMDQVRFADFYYAAERLGCTIKSMAFAEYHDGNGELDFVVYPSLVPLDSTVGRVESIENHIRVFSEYLNYVDLQGEGAGNKPTAASLLSDVFSNSAFPLLPGPKDVKIKAADDIVFDRWMIRAACYEGSGVLAKIFNAFDGIEIDEVFQIQSDDPQYGSVCESLGVDDNGKQLLPFVFTTNAASVGQINKALAAAFDDARDPNMFPAGAIYNALPFLPADDAK